MVAQHAVRSYSVDFRPNKAHSVTPLFPLAVLHPLLLKCQLDTRRASPQTFLFSCPDDLPVSRDQALTSWCSKYVTEGLQDIRLQLSGRDNHHDKPRELGDCHHYNICLVHPKI